MSRIAVSPIATPMSARRANGSGSARTTGGDHEQPEAQRLARSCPVGREPSKPSGAGLSETQSGATMTPNGRLATTQGTARLYLYPVLSDHRRAERHLDNPSSWAGQ